MHEPQKEMDVVFEGAAASLASSEKKSLGNTARTYMPGLNPQPGENIHTEIPGTNSPENPQGIECWYVMGNNGRAVLHCEYV